MAKVRERSAAKRLKARRKKGWGLLSSHGTVLFFVALNPGSTRREIANGLHLTERSVWSLVHDLQDTGAMRSRRDGRRHYYYVDLGTPLWEPLLRGYTVRSIVREFGGARRAGGGRQASGRDEAA